MPGIKTNIIAQLQKEILSLQGYKPVLNGSAVDLGLGPIKYAFSNADFPLGTVHEFICDGVENAAAAGGFISGILFRLMRRGGVTLWISSSRTIFPPALKSFGVDPDRIIFIDVSKERDVLWTMEEALKCDGLAAVVGEVQELNFTDSRRLQLVVEQSRVTGFILRLNPRNLNTTACVTRWQITPLPSVLPNDMPGIGFPQWRVELLKVRNGKPGIWQIEWKNKSFRHVYKFAPDVSEQQRKTG